MGKASRKKAKHTVNPLKNTSETSVHKKEQERTTRKKALFLKEFLESVGIIYIAAQAAGISERQVQTWRKEDKAFNQLFIEAEQSACGMVESEMVKQIKAGNTTLTIFYLVNRSHGRWENIQKVEQKPDDSTTKKIDELLSRTAKLVGLDQ